MAKPHIGPRPKGKPLTLHPNRREVVTLRDGTRVVFGCVIHKGRVKPVLLETPDGSVAKSERVA